MYTEITEVIFFAFVYRLFPEDFSSIEGPLDWGEIVMKQSVDKCS